MLWVKVAALLTGAMCLIVFSKSAYVALQLKHYREACRLKTWKAVKVCHNGSVRPVSELVFEFHLARWLTLASLVLIVAGLILCPSILDPVFKESHLSSYQSVYPMQVNSLLNGGIIIGLICSYSTRGYLRVMDKKIIKRQ